jgi:C-1 hydroxylase
MEPITELGESLAGGRLSCVEAGVATSIISEFGKHVSTQERSSPMSAEENKAVVRRVTEAIDEHNLEALTELVVPEVLPNLREALEWAYATFPDHRMSITDLVAEGDKVWVRLATSGGYAGGWRGIPATGQQWTNTGVSFFRLSDGKIVEVDSLFDVVNHVEQLGAKIVPPE